MQTVEAAVKAVIMQDKTFLLLKLTVGDREIWDLPGGKIAYGESPYETLLREVQEEVGLHIEIIKPLGLWWFYRIRDKGQVICNTFLCKPITKEINTERNPSQLEKVATYIWITKEDFLKGDYTVSDPSFIEVIKEI